LKQDGKKLQEICFPLDYDKTLFHIFHKLKKSLSTVEELTNDFYHVSIQVDHQENDEQLDARYVNYLKFSIQDELSMHRVCSMEEAYQLSLKAKENLNQQFSQRNRGARRGTSSTSRCCFNYGRGESS
jgi:hypothetical protein